MRIGLFSAILSIILTASAEERGVTIQANLESLSNWTINPLVFGLFNEEHWGDITPAIYEQYLINPSFEQWNFEGRSHKPGFYFQIPRTPGLAYPWQAINLVDGTDYSLSSDRVNSDYSQQIKIANDMSGGVFQLLPLPDYRVKEYRVCFYARAEGNIDLTVLLKSDSAHSRVMDDEPIRDLSEEWELYEIELNIKEMLPSRHLSHFGIAQLAFICQGEGTLWLDQATLFPMDCVEGVYNPESLENIDRFKPTAIRWPGGNFASGYHWRDGIGPINERPTKHNRPWSGLEPNHVGTDEWLRFCELAGLEPFFGIGFGETTVEEAAEWVEYCNGDISTPMGNLRAKNGHPEPYGVKYWGIGNEVYGAYQIGNTDAESYAKGYVEIAKAMKEKDASIELLAVGYGVHVRPVSRRNEWNQTVLDVAGEHIDFLDIHHYVYGPRSNRLTNAELVATLRGYLGATEAIEEYYQHLRQQLARSEITRNIKVAHLEWAVLPPLHNLSPRRQTFANALCTAVQLNHFLRNGDLVKQSAFHNYSYLVNPVPAHSEPPNPRSHITALYADFGGARVVETQVEAPTYDVFQDFKDIGNLEDVSEVDCLGLLSLDDRLHLCLVNRNLDEDLPVKIALTGSCPASYARLRTFESEDILEQYWWSTEEPVFQKNFRLIYPIERSWIFDLPKHSFAHLEFEIRR